MDQCNPNKIAIGIIKLNVMMITVIQIHVISACLPFEDISSAMDSVSHYQRCLSRVFWFVLKNSVLTLALVLHRRSDCLES